MTDPKPPTHERGPPQEKQHGLAIQFDAQEFAHFLDESDLTHEQKLEYIQTVWQIVLQFIDMGFGIHPLQQACGQIDEAAVLCGAADSSMVSFSHSTICNDFESSSASLCTNQFLDMQSEETS